MTLLVDGRWDGNFGIGRFGREVRRRLVIPGSELYTSEASALDPRGIAALWWRQRRDRSCDYFYSPGFTGTFGGTGASQLLTVWDLTHLQGEHASSRLKRAYYGTVVRPAIRRAGVVMTGCRASSDDIAVWLGPAARQVAFEVVGCGVSKDFQDLGLERAEATLAIVASTQSHKNVPVLLQALSEVPRVRAVWVVSDVEVATRMIVNAGVQDRVTLRPHVNDGELAEIYATSTALAFPSLFEGFGLPPIEAMSCGTPVIYASTCGAVVETCADVSANIGVERPRDPGAWAAAIEEACRRGTVPVTDFTRQPYTWDAVAQRVADVLGRYVDGVTVSSLDALG